MKILSHEYLEYLRSSLTLVDGALHEIPTSLQMSGSIESLTNEYNCIVAKIQFLEKFLELDVETQQQRTWR